MRRPTPVTSAALLALLFVAFAASAARAQGYSVEPVDGSLSVRPDDASLLPIGTTAGFEPKTTIDVPFEWTYYGRPVRTLTVSVDGWVRPEVGGTRPSDDGPASSAAALPISAGPRDGIVAVGWTEPEGDRDAEVAWVRTWTTGKAPERVLTVRWDRRTPGATSGRMHELRIEEREHRIVVVGRRTAEVAGLDEPSGTRFVLALSGEGTRFTPRRPRWNDPGTGREHVPVTWRDVRRESTIPDGCTRRCTYLAQGRHTFSVPDRARFRWDENGRRTKVEGDVLGRLRAEDLATFPPPARDDGRAPRNPGDADRWIRQVLDGKILLLPSDRSVNEGRAVRVWFRIIEYFDLDDRGATLADHHTWNLNRMLKAAFPAGDARREIDRYQAWKAMARGRLTVGKLFPTTGPRADALGNAAPQFDSGRGREYLLWSGRIRAGAPPSGGAETPSETDGWRRFALTEKDEARIVQRSDANDLRFVADPNYVDGGYEYVSGAQAFASGWIFGRTLPAPPLLGETLPRAGAPR